MKIYCFYLIKTELSNVEYPGIVQEEIFSIENIQCVLYAYTPNKEFKDLFIKMRNMKIFFEKNINLDKEEYENFYNNHKSQLLEYHSFNTKRVINNRYIPKPILVLSTLIESDHVLFYGEEYIDNILSDIISEDIIDYLNKHPLKESIMKVLNDVFIYDEIVNKIYPMEEINYDLYMIDDLSLFITLFSNTFKNNKGVIQNEDMEIL